MKKITIVFCLGCFVMYNMSAQSRDTSSLDGDIEKENIVLEPVERMPEFPGGQAEMYKYLAENLQLPDEAKEDNIGDKVVIQFVVTKEGTITHARVVKRLGYGCDEEALRVVNAMPKWNPGLHNGRAIPVTFTLPISLSLFKN